MKALNCVFPTGAILTVGGVCLCALLEWHSYYNTQDWEYAVLALSFFPALLLGSLLAIVGSFIDRKRLLIAQARARGVLCWAASGISFVLLATTGNVHRWTATFMFPTFVGFVAGSVFLWKLTSSRVIG